MMKKQLDQLKQLIRTTIVEQMDRGGTTPQVTYEMVTEEKPNLCDCFGRNYVVALAEAIQHSETPAESARFQEMFRILNRKYFKGQLPHHEVQVVYEVEFWIGKQLDGPMPAFTDSEHKRMFLRLCHVHEATALTLTCEMALAAFTLAGNNGSEGSLANLKEAGQNILRAVDSGSDLDWFGPSSGRPAVPHALSLPSAHQISHYSGNPSA